MYGICVFGDSIVFGRGNNKDRGWVGRLRKYFESKDYYNAVYNLGIPGNTSTDVLNRIDGECKSRILMYRPENKYVIIVGIGINDSKLLEPDNEQINTPEQFKENIQKIIRIAKKYTQDIVFVGLTPVDEKLSKNYETTVFSNERITQYNNIVKNECEENDIPFIDILNELLKLDYPKLLDDGLHPNAEGYEKMYDIIKNFLEEKRLI